MEHRVFWVTASIPSSVHKAEKIHEYFSVIHLEPNGVWAFKKKRFHYSLIFGASLDNNNNNGIMLQFLGFEWFETKMLMWTFKQLDFVFRLELICATDQNRQQNAIWKISGIIFHIHMECEEKCNA